VSGWIKFEKDLEDDPRVLRMAKALAKQWFFAGAGACFDGVINARNADALPGVTLVLGALARLWIYADSHAREDDTLDLGARELDEIIGIPGFCALMPHDWLLEIDENTVELPGFQAHNGVEAKKKAQTQKRVERHRNNKKPNSVSPSNASALPDQDQTKTSKRGAKRASRAPEDFKPDLSYALSIIPDIDAEEEARKFRDWEFKTPRSDWPAVWRNWIGTCKESGRYARKDQIKWQ
jgi:hypothetical protein